MEKDQPLIISLPFNQLRRLLRCVLELRQNFERFLGAAREDHLFFGELQRVIGDHNKVSAHTQEAADREYDEWPLAVWAHEEIVNLTDGFVGIVDDAAPNDFGRAIAGRQLMHIDFGELYDLWRALRSCAAGEKGTAARTIVFFIICFPQLVALSLVSLSVRSDPSPRLNQLLPWTRVPCITATASGGAPAALDSKKTQPAFLHCRLTSARLAGPLVEW